jgi:hypothetical protein
MRSLFLFSIGLTTVACGLSMNPDLPSNREGDSGGLGATSGDGDIGLNPDLGSPSEGAGGASCTGLGGAGGGDSTAHESGP